MHNEPLFQSMKKTLEERNRALMIINAMAIELASLPSSNAIKEFLVKTLKEMTGACVAVFSEFDPADRTLVVRYVEADPGISDMLISVLGKRLEEVRTIVDELNYQKMLDSVIRRKEDLREMTFGAIPREAAAEVQKRLSVDRFYAIAYVIEGELYGTSVLAMKAGTPDPPMELVESFAHMAAVSLRRRRVEDDLRRSQEAYRDLVENINDVIFSINKAGVVTYINPVVERVTGFKPEELMGRQVKELIYKDDLARIMEAMKDVLGGNLYPSEYRMLTRSGGTRWVRSSSRPIMEGKEVVGIQGVLIDIEERKQADEKLRESEEKYRSLIENATDGIIIIQDGIVMFANPMMAKINGSTVEELVGTSMLEHIHSSDIEKVMRMYKKRMAGENVPSGYEALLKKKDGSPVPCELNSNRITYKGKPADLVVIRDITERKRLEENLMQAQKMETVGIMAGGIAHDFNNILTVIKGNLEFALRRTDNGSPLFTDLSEARDATRRAADIIRQLLLFSRKRQPDQMTSVSINEVVTSMHAILVRLIPADITIELSLSDDLWLMKIEEGMIEQLIMNLAINARDAMPDGGKLSISTCNVSLGAEAAALSPEAAPGDYVSMTVKDNGVGMANDTLQRIFEPFYSTKDISQGSGLGLSVVYGVVKQLRGWISVESEPGKGSEFRIFFPAQRAVLTRVDDKEAGEPVRGKGGRILFVDDEEGIRRFAGKILSDYGYVVRCAKDASEAIALFGQEHGGFDLLFSDQVLPDRRGTQLAAELLKRKPGLKVLIGSGYFIDDEVNGASAAVKHRFLAKPYELDSMLGTIDEIMRGA